jgi:hypothetical protein
MGYRSNVGALFYTTDPANEALLKLFVDENFSKDEWMRGALRWFSTPNAAGYAFEVDDVKWYESYSDVKGFNAFVDKFTSFFDGKTAATPASFWAYEFVRMGEDYNDIEVVRDGPDRCMLGIRRSITCDV